MKTFLILFTATLTAIASALAIVPVVVAQNAPTPKPNPIELTNVLLHKMIEEAEIRRFEIVMHPQFRGDQYILDTTSGRVWQLVKAKDDSFLWQEMPRQDLKY